MRLFTPFIIFGFFICLTLTGNATLKSVTDLPGEKKKSRPSLSSIKKKEKAVVTKRKSKPEGWLQRTIGSDSALSKETLSEAAKYQEAFLSICKRQPLAEPHSRLLSFTEIIEQLRLFSEKQTRAPQLKDADKTFWNRVGVLISPQALPYQQILNEKEDASGQAAFLAEAFETHYRSYYQMPENESIRQPWPKIILEVLGCIQGPPIESP